MTVIINRKNIYIINNNNVQSNNIGKVNAKEIQIAADKLLTKVTFLPSQKVQLYELLQFHFSRL